MHQNTLQKVSKKITQILWVALFWWLPIFVDWTKMTHSWGSQFVAIAFSFIIHTENHQFVGTVIHGLDYPQKPRKLSHLQYPLHLINIIYIVCISLDLSILIFLLVYLALCWNKDCTYIWLFSSFPARAIRDSGYSSGDPSPNNSVFQDSPTNSHLAALQCKRYQRSNSTPSPQAVRTSKKKIKRPSTHTLSSVISWCIIIQYL